MDISRESEENQKEEPGRCSGISIMNLYMIPM